MQTPQSSLVDALVELRAAAVGMRLGLPIDGAPAAVATQHELVGQIDDYLLPRLRQLDAPLLMVVGGSTGAGKSTLVNSLVGAAVSAAGVLRPTTRAPVLVCNPGDVDWFTGDRVLPGLPRSTGAQGGHHALHVVPHPQVPQGLALLDAPDIDSVVTENRELSRQLLAAADLWLFVTTAARYADAVPWDLLHAARARSTALAVVLNRAPPGSGPEVSAHLREMLQDNGLGDSSLFVVDESVLDERGMLADASIAPVRGWMNTLGADAEARAAVVRGTLVGALDSIPQRVNTLANAAEAQRSAAAALLAEAHAAYARARDEVDEGVTSGALLRGEVLARWQDFVGTGEFMRSLESRIGVLRDRLRAAFSGRPPAGTELKAALESSVESLVRAAADRAADRTYESWSASAAGRALVGSGAAHLARASTTLPAAVEREVRAWQGHVLELVSQEGAGKRTAARFLSYSVNAAGLAVMVTVFAHTGGLTGGEVAVAGGTSALGQKLLEAVFGDQAVRALAESARTDLLARVESVLAAERERFDERAIAAVAGADAAAQLRAAGALVGAARRGAFAASRP
ncbi:MAG: ABC transporter [Mycobacteriales bacterium]